MTKCDIPGPSSLKKAQDTVCPYILLQLMQILLKWTKVFLHCQATGWWRWKMKSRIDIRCPRKTRHYSFTFPTLKKSHLVEKLVVYTHKWFRRQSVGKQPLSKTSLTVLLNAFIESEHMQLSLSKDREKLKANTRWNLTNGHYSSKLSKMLLQDIAKRGITFIMSQKTSHC